MRNIKIEPIIDHEDYKCDSCEVMCADLCMQYFHPDYTWNAQCISLCRSCVALFREELKKEFKIMDARYSKLKRARP